MKEKSTRLYLRVSPQEKEKIDGLAKSCGLSTAEYIRRRALGFMPKTSVPDSFFSLTARLSELLNRDLSPARNRFERPVQGDYQENRSTAQAKENCRPHGRTHSENQGTDEARATNGIRGGTKARRQR